MQRLTSLFFVTFSASVLSCGCTDNAPKGSSPKWTGSGASQSVVRDGANYSSVAQELIHDGRVYFVMRCSAGPGEGANTVYDSLNGDAKGTFAIHPDSRQVAWTCTTQDGKSGSVVIDGQNFDLAKGAVFLVTLNDKKTNVDQVAVDMAKLQGGAVEQKLQAIGATEPRIAAFLKASRGEK